MALIAHWPLNGNTNDISGNKNTLINNGTTFMSNGKIGQAVDFDGSTTRSLTTTDGNFSTETFSISFWAFYDDYTYPKTMGAIKKSTGNTYSAGTIGWDFGHGYVASGVRTTINDGTNLIDTSVTFDEGYRPIDFINKWVHLSFIVDRNFKKVKYYVNGIKQSYELDISSITGTISSSNNLVFGTLYGWISDSRFNDLRLYNHALTDMEVQEIARAKILHYTFDDMQEPTTNYGRMLETISLQSGLSGHWSVQKLNRDTLKVTALVNNPNLATWGDVTMDISGTRIISAGKPVTLSCEIVDFKGSLSRIFPASGGFGSIIGFGTFMGRNFRTITYTADWTHNLLIRASDAANIVAGDYVTVRFTQIEEKAYPTEYTENTRTGRVNDYSGFFNHSVPLTETATPRWTPEAKIGTGCYLSNADNLGIQTISMNTPNTITQSLWFYPFYLPSEKSGIYQNIINETNDSLNVFMITDHLEWKLIYDDNSSTPRININETHINKNQWNHLTLTYDGTTAKGYINGVLRDTRVANKALKQYSNTNFNLFRDNSGFNTGFFGSIDDVRIYATALSDKDIRDLYEARAEIEQSGVLYARDFLSNVEETVNLFGTNPGMSLIVDSATGITSGNDSIGNYFIKDTALAQWYQGLRINNNGLLPLYSGSSYIFSVYLRSDSSEWSISYDANASGGDWLGNDNGRISNIGYFEKTGASFYTSDMLGTWQRYIFKVQMKTWTDGSLAFPHDSFFPNLTNIKIYYKDPQFEMNKINPTPFVSTYRPASQLPSTIEFGADEVHETGTANFEDFSTVGITDGLIGYWPMNDGTVRDLSGTGYGTTVNGTVYLQNSRYFDGIDDYINTNFNGRSTWSEPYTIMISVKIPSSYIWNTSYRKNIFGNGSYNGVSGLSASGTENVLGFWLRHDSGSFAVDGPAISRDQWVHMVGTWDGVSALKYYQNGIFINTSTVTSITGVPDTSGWVMGNNNAYSGASGGFMELYLKDAKYFNHALTAEEVAIEYNTMFNDEVQVHESGTVYAKDFKQY